MEPLLVVLLVLALSVIAWLVATRVATPALPVPAPPVDQQLVAQQVQALTAAVQQLGERTARQMGEVDQSLRTQAEVAQALHHTTAELREALANSNARGQWGERMADDVLRLAGLLPNVNYVKRTAVAGEGRVIPDFTFLLPDRHVMFMDVKFPVEAYLAYLQGGSDTERAFHRDAFLRAVRGHMKSLARRDYATVDDRPSVQNVLMFVPNETIVGFIHEHAPALVDEALRDQVVLCSPLTLFAFLGVIRQAFDNFRLEQTSHEVLAALGRFDLQWRKYQEHVDRVQRQLSTLSATVDELVGPRRRQLERPLMELEALRRERHIPVDDGLHAVEA